MGIEKIILLFDFSRKICSTVVTQQPLCRFVASAATV